MRISENPPPAICHTEPPPARPWKVSGHARSMLTSGSSSSSASCFGMRASSAPPLTTSKRMTALVDGSPTVLCRITFEPTPNWRKSTITSTRSAGSSGIDVPHAPACRQQPAVGADLDHLAAVAELERVGAGVGRVEEAQPVQPPLDLHPRRDRAVDEDRVAAEAAVEVEPVAERPVGVERAVLDHQRDVVVALRQVERLVVLVVEDVERRQPREQRLSRSRRARGRGTRASPSGRRWGTCRAARSRSGSRRADGRRTAAAVTPPCRCTLRSRPLWLIWRTSHRAAARGPDRRPREEPVVAEDRRLEPGQDVRRPGLHRDHVLLELLRARRPASPPAGSAGRAGTARTAPRAERA